MEQKITIDDATLTHALAGLMNKAGEFRLASQTTKSPGRASRYAAVAADYQDAYDSLRDAWNHPR